jgi:hypothetical protein
MKVFVSAAFCVLASAACAAQNAPQNPPSQPAPASQQPAPQQPGGKVIFSRSIDANGETKTESASQPQLTNTPVATDAERDAVTFTAYDLDVRLRSAEHRIAVRARLTVRNDGKAPLAHIPLQVSSTLNWERIRIGSKDAAFEASTLNSDSDHTGRLHEAAVKLDTPLAPGTTVALDATYSGIIELAAQRLQALGTPDNVAVHSDWDRIDTDFTGLRGFGNVVWYPVSAPPVILGDGARLFDEIGQQKARMSAAHFHLRLTAEFPHGQAPNIALINGHPIPLAVTDSETAGAEVAGVATAELQPAALGFEAPSLFLAIRTPHSGTNLTAFTRTENDAFASSWTQAETVVTPFLQRWFGQKPLTQLTLLDLPDSADAPYETGPLLVTPIVDADPEQLKSALAHGLAHAWFQSQQAWLHEGVPYFISTLWTERQFGREKALEMLEASRSALALAEPESPGQSAGQPLGIASAPIYYRTKAAYVFWMLRGIVGDDALSAALRSYDPSKETTQPPSQLETLLEKSANTDLHWFFADWVDADHGLPDLSIENVFLSTEQSGNTLVAVHLANSGYAAVEVPITVRTATTPVTQRIQVPARGKAVPRILIQGHPIEVRLNDGAVPEINATVHVKDIGPAPTANPAKP